MRPIWRNFVKIWNLIVGNFYDTLYSYFVKALGTQYNAVVRFSTALLFNGLSRDISGVFFQHRLSASCAPIAPTIYFALPSSSFSGNTSCECHSISPPSDEWRKEYGDHYSYYVGGKRTGITITPKREIYVHRHRDVAKGLKLKQPTFLITHYVLDEDYDIHDTLNIVQSPTLEKAKHLAEWYYEEWLKVNHDLLSK